MTIRSRLLLLLLPTLFAFILLISLFFYYNWSREILDSFKWRLLSVVVATAQTVDADEVNWIQNHMRDEDITQNKKYIEYKDKLFQLKQKLPITHLYLVKIEPSDNDTNFRQVFLLDVSGETFNEGNKPGDIDFSESDEHRIYFTKKAFVTPIYEAKKTGERFMSAYAPIMNNQGHVLALLGADVSMVEIDAKLNRALLMIVLGALFTALMIVISVFLIAEKISKPVRQLNQAALDIAAGEYETDIKAEGPIEVMELANTLNTMSECLEDNLNRLKESSLIRERLYGESECAQLLQYYMLQKVVEEFNLPLVKLKLSTTPPTKTSAGLALRYELLEGGDIDISLLESTKSGFRSLVKLNQNSSISPSSSEDYNFINCFFAKDEYLRYNQKNMHPPLIWSVKEEEWLDISENEIPLHSRDMVFLVNSTLIDYFQTEEALRTWFARVLRHFAKDGLDHIQTILTNEINFLYRREGIKNMMTIIMIQGRR